MERAKYNNATGSEPAVDGEMALFPTHISVTDRQNVELQYVPLRAVTYGYVPPENPADNPADFNTCTWSQWPC